MGCNGPRQPAKADPALNAEVLAAAPFPPSKACALRTIGSHAVSPRSCSGSCRWPIGRSLCSAGPITEIATSRRSGPCRQHRRPLTPAARATRMQRHFEREWIARLGDPGLHTDPCIRDELKPAGWDRMPALRNVAVCRTTERGRVQSCTLTRRISS